MSYFSNLNYSLANEDTTVEFEMVGALRSKSILAVAGSGSRSLPFLAHVPQTLKLVDVARQQLDFVRFKELSLKRANHDELITFWNGKMDDEERARLIKLWCGEDLDPAQLLHWLSRNPGIPPLYWGKWEKTFIIFSKLAGFVLGPKHLQEMFEVPNPGKYFTDNISGMRWRFLLKLMGNRAVFNSLLYKGHFIRKNDPRSYFDYYYQSYAALMALDLRRSHFAQLCFQGEVVLPEGLPLEFQPTIHGRILGSSTEVEYSEESLLAHGDDDRFDFISLSDVPSYFSGDTEKEFWQIIRRKLRPGGVAVARYYLRRPEGMDLTGLKDITDEWRHLWEKELVQMYQFHILKREN